MMNVNEFLKKCTVVKNTTKKANNLIDNYCIALRKYGCRTLSDCYSGYSCFKGRAYENIRKEYLENKGYSMTIPTYNSMSFTQAYLIADGEDEWLIYHTSHNRYAVHLTGGLNWF